MKVLGIDMGSNSIGLSVRNPELGNDLENQLEYFSSVIFSSGVGNGKTGEYSYAAERTKYRSSRRLYQSRKYRKWETLKVLRYNKLCPLSESGLAQWSIYNKAKGLYRKYPVNEQQFEQWIKLDFNGDGKPDYASPYQLRDELMNRQLDMKNAIDRYKLGRALYHIAQRRGFKSSKGETIKEQENLENNSIESKPDKDIIRELKKSEDNKSKELTTYMKENNLKTVGQAFALLERNGIRIRGGKYQAIRSQYKEEVYEIFKFQQALSTDSDLFDRIISERKEKGSIFYKKPLRSQKGLVGLCTMERKIFFDKRNNQKIEKGKPRCPISHPDFEEFRAWSLINNIRYRRNAEEEWQSLALEDKHDLFNEKFLLTRSNFKFEDIAKWLSKRFGIALSYKDKTLNYKEKTNVAGCPISGRLKNLLGDNWKSMLIPVDKEKVNRTTGEVKKITYNYEDIWHICFSYDESEFVYEFGIKRLGYNEIKANELVRIWGAIQQGYGMLSLKAIRNINPFLKQGYPYTEAVLLAKIPELMGSHKWEKYGQLVEKSISDIIVKNRFEKRILNIVNNLIGNYKSLQYNDEGFATKEVNYLLDEKDKEQIEEFCIANYGAKSWSEMSVEKRGVVLDVVREDYQAFFKTEKRDFFKIPKVSDALKEFLSKKFEMFRCENYEEYSHQNNCKCDACKKLNKLYHPSQIAFYPPAIAQSFNYNGVQLSMKLLESPVIGSFKNPMAMKALHILRKEINKLLKEGIIDEDTRIVVETARDLNDANKRWAIRKYQGEREKENDEISKIIQTYFNTNRKISNDEIQKAKLLIDQHEIPVEDGMFEKNVKKYKLWLEQGCRCIYTGKPLNLTSLFSENNTTDFEHTIPRSKSFDNSLANLTVCDAYYNRTIKKNKLPFELENYEKTARIGDEEYPPIKDQLKHWKKKVERLQDNVNNWKFKAKRAQDKPAKDFAIRQRHLWEMELDYWKNKLERFTMKEVKSSFKNSQLVDTRLITKYVFHYLKTVFNSVDVQKGEVTADFRKMLGVQKAYEKKDRTKHSHHAIDAATLTLIPKSAKREKMLSLFYKIEEHKKLNKDTPELQEELNKERLSCNFNKVKNMVPFIEDKILIKHESKNQALAPAKKVVRKRKKIVKVKNNRGEKVSMVAKGDSIRGQLHEETFYGKIKALDKKDEFWMVGRKKIEELNPKTDIIVDKALSEHIHQQIDNGVELNKLKDKAGNTIRHIRCRVKAGRGFLSPDDVTTVKQQTYLSRYDYKNYYYANSGDNFGFALYVDENKKPLKIIPKSLFEVSKQDIDEHKKIEDYFERNIMVGRGQRKKIGELYNVFQVGQHVLFYVDDKEELKHTDNLSSHLYVVKTLFDGKTGRIQFQHHLEARTDEQLIRDFPDKDENGKKLFGKAGKNGFSSFGLDFIRPRLLLTVGKLNCIYEGKDFEFKADNQIRFFF
ncbi:CRISPR-associated protein Cas9/Csn1, subtype II/NMEMI [Salinivirga cyanobacteriivorans]|uniref:CRISPR-associated protein Cas9/Csn1, subtype II/NMEMI n=1 Tax=Salinivirga cyanobacteriivorans TaxID=1307839 RepID=A0A0S2HX99_9BACT|nr:type II CRISPR RNA-guided endonuclease Cas9 [Salinivirga cyanobacteriivorans]ALO14664.1 CRISPR-associated protein Cas9/Csn1, subtype II/NMEMI [Salinivirga cyanobacteriivorans]